MFRLRVVASLVCTAALVWLLVTRPWLSEIQKYQWPKPASAEYQVTDLESFFQNPPAGFELDPCTASLRVEFAEPIDPDWTLYSLGLGGTSRRGTGIGVRKDWNDRVGGQHVFDPLLGGTYTLRLYAHTPHLVGGHDLVAWQAHVELAPGEHKTVRMAVKDDLLELRIRLLDQSGTSAQTGWVRLQVCPDTAPGTAYTHQTYTRREANVGNDGIAVLEQVVPDVYAVSAWCGPSGVMIQDRIDLRGKTGVVEASFVLDPGVALRGRVVDGQGQGLGNAIVYVKEARDSVFTLTDRLKRYDRENDAAPPGCVWARATPHGDFTLAGLDVRSRFVLTACHPDYDSVTLHPVHPPAENVSFRLVRRSPEEAEILAEAQRDQSAPRTGRSQSQGGLTPAEPQSPDIPDVDVVFTSADGSIIPNALVFNHADGFLRADERGIISLGDVGKSKTSDPFAALHIAVHEPGLIRDFDNGSYWQFQKGLLYPNAAPTDPPERVTYSMVWGAVLAGRITDAQDRPLDRVTMTLYYPLQTDPDSRYRTEIPHEDISQTDGTFLLSVRPLAETVYVVLEEAGYARQWYGPFPVVPGKVVHGLHFTLSKIEPHRLLIRDRYGLPIVGSPAVCLTGIRSPQGPLVMERKYMASDRYGIITIRDSAAGERVRREQDPRNPGGTPISLPESRESPIELPSPEHYPEISARLIDGNGGPIVGANVRLDDAPSPWGVLEPVRQYFFGPRPSISIYGRGTIKGDTDENGIVRFWYDPSLSVIARSSPIHTKKLGVLSARYVDSDHYTLGEIQIAADGTPTLRIPE